MVGGSGGVDFLGGFYCSHFVSRQSRRSISKDGHRYSENAYVWNKVVFDGHLAFRPGVYCGAIVRGNLFKAILPVRASHPRRRTTDVISASQKYGEMLMAQKKPGTRPEPRPLSKTSSKGK